MKRANESVFILSEEWRGITREMMCIKVGVQEGEQTVAGTAMTGNGEYLCLPWPV